MNELEIARNKINEVDKEIAKLFEKRMEIVKDVVKYKQAHHMNILDSSREKEVIERNSQLVKGTIRDYYCEVLQCMMDVSKEYQKEIMEEK